MGVGASGEGGDLFVAHMQPFDAAAPPNGVGEAIETVADDAIDPLHSGGGENLDHLVGDGLGHRLLPGSARQADDKRKPPMRDRAGVHSTDPWLVRMRLLMGQE